MRQEEMIPSSTPLSYAPPVPARPWHDVVYTSLLGAVAFFQIFGALTSWFTSRLPTRPPESVWALHFVVAIQLLYVAFETAVLIIRIAAPRYRKWPTVILNIVLLASFPFGTLLGIYGLWKADKSPAPPAYPLRQEPVA